MTTPKESLVFQLECALMQLNKIQQLGVAKAAIADICYAIKSIKDSALTITYCGCYVEPVKQPVDLLTDDELLAEIKKRMNRIGFARAS